MPKQVMRRQASDNEYLHRDFHGALSCGIDYLQQHFGEDAVREYLRTFALTYYAPVREALRQRGLPALREHFERLYRVEGGQAEIELDADTLTIRVAACPAVQHMRAHGYAVAELFHETSRTVNDALCEGTEYCAELVEYDPETGAGVQRFSKRAIVRAGPVR